MKQKKGRFRLLVTISVLFTALIVAFGLIFRQYTFWKMSEIILNDSAKFFSQIEEELSLKYSSIGNVADQTVQIIGQTGVLEAFTLADRLQYLRLFAAALDSQEEMTGLQVGYNNGDYFIVRQLYNEEQKKRFTAPPAAEYVVDNTDIGENNRRYLQRIWLDKSLVELDRAAPEETAYDPRVRPWFKAAITTAQSIATRPYLFYFTKEMGITIALHHEQNHGVVAADFSLANLSLILSKYKLTSRSEILLLEKKAEEYWLTAYKNPEKMILSEERGERRAQAHELDSPVIQHASQHEGILNPVWDLNFRGEKWLGSTRPLQTPNTPEERYYLVTLMPENELFVEAKKMQNQAMTFTLLMILLTIPLTWYLATRISSPIQSLAKDADRIRNFQFNGHRLKNSFIKEVDDLDQSMNMMEMTIGRFIQLIHSLSSEKDFGKLLQRITEETMKISGADGAFSYIVDDTDNTLNPGSVEITKGVKPDKQILPSYGLQDESSIVKVLGSEQRVVIPLADLFEGGPPAELGISSQQVVVLPLRNRQGENIGLLCLLFEKSSDELHAEDHAGRLAFIDALSGFAAVTLESRKMLLMQKELLESFIKLIAGAIDSKSPYTGGHCQRVPVLTKLLAQRACESQKGVFTDFSLTDDEWEAIHIASWLHDCGKVTTPEYVVDKATKLETLYDRIHEIRTRFEVLKRDAHIRYFEKLAEGGNEKELKLQLVNEWKELDGDFCFVAECNLGGEFMAPEKLERLRKIGERTWLRTLSDRIGISWEEQQRKERMPEPALPFHEKLLDDRPDHLYQRDDKYCMPEDNEYGFKLNVPHHLYNKGELYNLSITRGTLNYEERYHINDHIVQTIIMLKKLPYPKHLAEVPDIAGGHHEKIDGTGYPRKLNGEEMSWPAKMMVIADIFEALTASDRPYKKAKTLSEAIKIMGFMEKDKHIDTELFQLFLESGVYKEYAEEYLLPAQIDEVDISSYLG